MTIGSGGQNQLCAVQLGAPRILRGNGGMETLDFKILTYLGKKFMEVQS